MPHRTDQATRARAEALFKRREQQRIDAPIAMAEYRAAQQAALARMRELRHQRLARRGAGRTPGAGPE